MAVLGHQSEVRHEYLYFLLGYLVSFHDLFQYRAVHEKLLA